VIRADTRTDQSLVTFVRTGQPELFHRRVGDGQRSGPVPA
jgi:hypothetical protein